MLKYATVLALCLPSAYAGAQVLPPLIHGTSDAQSTYDGVSGTLLTSSGPLAPHASSIMARAEVEPLPPVASPALVAAADQSALWAVPAGMPHGAWHVAPAEVVEPQSAAVDDAAAVGESVLDAPATADLIVEEVEEPWYVPNAWFDPTWSGSVEFGLNGTTGNSETASYRITSNLRRETERHVLAFDATHARTSSGSDITQNNALSNLKYEFLFPETPWSLFTKTTLEYDQFKAFDLRWLLNGGVGYRFIKTERTRLEGRFGSGVSQEVGGPDDDIVPEAAFGIDFEMQITKRQKITTTVDYFPEWTSFSDFRLYTNSGWEVLLDEETNLSMKLGAIDRYDSTPNGRQPNDLDYMMTLVWKL